MLRAIILGAILSIPLTGMSAGPAPTLLIPDKVYTPVGFDDNDNAQFVFEGYYPSSCYRSGIVTQSIDKATKKIVVQNKAYYYEGIICMPMLTPYNHAVSLGVVTEGNYEIFFRGETDTESTEGPLVKMGNLKVAHSESSDPDDYLYAPVDKVWVSSDAQGSVLTVAGGYSNTCMSMDKVDLRRTDDVIVVLPKAKMGTEDCAIPIVPIPYQINVPMVGIGEGRVLFHVRSLSGQAVNSLVDLPKD